MKRRRGEGGEDINTYIFHPATKCTTEQQCEPGSFYIANWVKPHEEGAAREGERGEDTALKTTDMNYAKTADSGAELWKVDLTLKSLVGVPLWIPSPPVKF